MPAQLTPFPFSSFYETASATQSALEICKASRYLDATVGGAQANFRFTGSREAIRAATPNSEFPSDWPLFTTLVSLDGTKLVHRSICFADHAAEYLGYVFPMPEKYRAQKLMLDYFLPEPGHYVLHDVTNTYAGQTFTFAANFGPVSVEAWLSADTNHPDAYGGFSGYTAFIGSGEVDDAFESRYPDGDNTPAPQIFEKLVSAIVDVAVPPDQITIADIRLGVLYESGYVFAVHNGVAIKTIATRSSDHVGISAGHNTVGLDLTKDNGSASFPAHSLSMSWLSDTDFGLATGYVLDALTMNGAFGSPPPYVTKAFPVDGFNTKWVGYFRPKPVITTAVPGATWYHPVQISVPGMLTTPGTPGAAFERFWTNHRGTEER